MASALANWANLSDFWAIGVQLDSSSSSSVLLLIRLRQIVHNRTVQFGPCPTFPVCPLPWHSLDCHWSANDTTQLTARRVAPISQFCRSAAVAAVAAAETENKENTERTLVNWAEQILREFGFYFTFKLNFLVLPFYSTAYMTEQCKWPTKV